MLATLAGTTAASVGTAVADLRLAVEERPAVQHGPAAPPPAQRWLTAAVRTDGAVERIRRQGRSKAFTKPINPSRMKRVTYRFFNDDPVDGSDAFPDLLGHQRYADHAVQLLRDVREQSESGVLALIGPWGSGKSSVLKMVLRRLREAQPASWSVAELNPWLYSDLDSLTAALFSEIRTALPKGARWSVARETIRDFGVSVSPLGKVGSLFGFDLSDAVKGVAERIGGDTSTSAAKTAAAEALREVDRPVLVVMDDLDRLTPDELLLVFKLVRLVGNLPNVYYLISFDERTLLDVLGRSALVGGERHRASEFLEKIVQVRLDLPVFRERDASKLVERCLAALLGKLQLSLTAAEEQRFARAYVNYLQDRLLTPRAVKRLFGQVAASLGTLAGEVDLVDFLLVTFLRTSEPGVYRFLGRHRAELTGSGFASALARRRQQPDELAEVWRARLRKAGVAEGNLDGILSLLASLFPGLAHQLGGSTSEPPEERRGIGSSDYFDRYVVFGVPDDDLPEAVLTTALAQLGSGAPGVEADELWLRFQNDTQRIARRIRLRLRAGGSLPVRQLLIGMAELFASLPVQSQELLSPRFSVVIIAQDLFRTLEADERVEVLDQMAASASGAELAALVLGDAIEPSSTGPAFAQESDEWVVAAHTAVLTRLEQHLTAAGGRPAGELSDLDTSLIWRWRRLDGSTARRWVRQRLDDGTWDLLPFLTELLPAPRAPWSTIDADVLESLDTLVDRAEVQALCDRTEVPDDDSASAQLLHALSRTLLAEAGQASGPTDNPTATDHEV
ncbi:P-loop NTPase fold protein [Kitasatospora sp. NPDC057223]|uniref:P-loop NTPase fold protein n=1 Tax=Kitasatospora sp. NPDC057223 TaxID=3346055 RepID=UPI0036344BA0